MEFLARFSGCRSQFNLNRLGLFMVNLLGEGIRVVSGEKWDVFIIKGGSRMRQASITDHPQP